MEAELGRSQNNRDSHQRERGLGSRSSGVKAGGGSAGLHQGPVPAACGFLIAGGIEPTQNRADEADVCDRIQSMKSPFENSPVRRTMPKICLATNLPAFDSESQLDDYNEPTHWPILAKWHCRECHCWHYWSGAPGDTNGGTLAGSREVPERIKKLIEETRMKFADKFCETEQ